MTVWKEVRIVIQKKPEHSIECSVLRTSGLFFLFFLDACLAIYVLALCTNNEMFDANIVEKTYLLLLFHRNHDKVLLKK